MVDSNNKTLPVMVYDIKVHRQVLTQDGVKNVLGYDLAEFFGEPENIKIKLDEFSQDCYGWLGDNTRINNYDIYEYLFATDDRFKEIIQEAMLAQVRYSVRARGFLIKDQTGINSQEVTSDEIEKYRGDVTLALPAIRVFRRNGLVTNKLYNERIPNDVVRGVDY